MSTLYVFVAAIAITGGFIAWSGDRLGTWVGKKRISKFGLRPRHTAMLYTIWTGVFIATATLLSLMRFDSTVEMSLTHGAQIIADNKKKAAKLKIQDVRIAANDTTIAQQTTTIGQLGSQKSVLEAQLTAMRGQLAGTQAQLAATQHQLGQTEASLTATNLALTHTTGQLKLSNEELQAYAADMKVYGQKLAAGHKQILIQTARNQELAARNMKIASSNADLEKKNEDLDRQRFQLGADVASLQQVPIAFHKGQELGRREFATNQPVASIHAQLDSFLADLSRTGLDNGLVAGGNGHSVQIASMPMDTASGAPAQDIDESANIDALAQSIAGLGKTVGSVVVIALAHNNTTRGEQALIDLHPYNNVLIFSRGSVIATTIVDGSQSEDGVRASLEDFLENKVHDLAVSQGIIPTYDSLKPHGSVGELADSTEWTDLVHQIRQIGADAQITAAAREDIYSKGPLRLTFTAAAASRTQRATASPPDSPRKDRQISDGRTQNH